MSNVPDYSQYISVKKTRVSQQGYANQDIRKDRVASRYDGYFPLYRGTSLPPNALLSNKFRAPPPFNPLSISDMALWFDAADLNTLSFVTGTEISEWRDKSPTGTKALPEYGVSPSNKVTYSADNGVYINNNDNANYIASTVSSMRIQSNIQTTADFSIVAMIKYGSALSTGGTNVQTIYSNQRPNDITNPSSVTVAPSFGFGAALEISKVPIVGRGVTFGYTPNSTALVSMLSTSASSTIHRNGTQAGQDLTVLNRCDTDGGTFPQFGATGIENRVATGFWYEFFLFNKTISTTERQELEGYLAWKWGTRASLPIDHPYIKSPPTGRI